MITNFTAILVVLVQTNWTAIGTFTDNEGHTFTISQGVVWTNTIGRMTYEDQTVDFRFKADRGETLTNQIATTTFPGAFTSRVPALHFSLPGKTPSTNPPPPPLPPGTNRNQKL